MKRFQQAARGLGLLCLLVGVASAGLTGTPPTPGETFSCADDQKIEKSIAPEAELVDFSCVIKKYEGADTLHFNVVLKNVSNQPQRFRVHIFLDNGKAAGGLIPEKTDAARVEPGQTASFVYPVTAMSEVPGSIELVVKPVAP